MHILPTYGAPSGSDLGCMCDCVFVCCLQATAVNTASKMVSFADGTSLKYDTLFLATGSTPRTIPVPGITLENVFLLRDPAHANAIHAAAEGKRVVLVGTGFIGELGLGGERRRGVWSEGEGRGEYMKSGMRKHEL